MQLKNRVLMVRRSGDDVKELQSELTALGFDVPEDEISRAFFGQGTRDAVYKFQQDNGLPASGIVNQETADKLSEMSA